MIARYTTITIREDVKKKLEKFKGKKSWDDFLIGIFNDYLKFRRIIAAMMLEKIGFSDINSDEVRSHWNFKKVEL